jgi:Carboxypeptidase regulatory-like domain
MRVACLLASLAACLTAQQTAGITGTVTSAATHAPVAGVCVSVNLTGAQQTQSCRATTDPTGAYLVSGLDPGGYTVSFTADGFIPATSRSVRVGEGSARVDTVLLPAARLRGRVLDTEAQPAANVAVELYPYRGGRPIPVKTDGEGRFEFPRLAPGVYALLARPAAAPKDGTVLSPAWFPGFADRAQAERIIVRSGAEMAGYEIRLKQAAVFGLRGTVLNEQGKPAGRVLVRLDPTDIWQPFEAQIMSASDGTFEFSAVRPGEWRLHASVPLATNEALEGFASVSVDKHDVERVQVRLLPPFSLDGFIDRDEPRDPNGKRKVSGVYLTPVGGDGTQVLALHEQDGSIHFPKVVPGRYIISPVGYIPGYYVESVQLGDRDVFGKPIDLRDGTIPFRVVYKPNAGQVRGNVENCAGSTVALLPEDEALLDGQFIRTAACDANGRYEIGSLRPGDYYAFAFDRVDTSAFEDVTFVRNLRPAAVLVHVEAGHMADADLKVTPWPE